jgi:hypothetical protein
MSISVYQPRQQDSNEQNRQCKTGDRKVTLASNAKILVFDCEGIRLIHGHTFPFVLRKLERLHSRRLGPIVAKSCSRQSQDAVIAPPPRKWHAAGPTPVG